MTRPSSTPISASPQRQPLDGIDVIWEVPLDDETGVIAAVFDTPNGEVRLD